MLDPIRARRSNSEEGFTLIELMVVVLILAILMAIAIPTFLGARTRAQDRAAQSNLRNALTSADTIFADTQDYNSVPVSSLASAEPNLTFTTGTIAAGTTGNVVVVGTGGSAPADYMGLAALSASGTCWLELQVANAATTFGSTTGACTPPTPSTTGMTASW